MGYMIGIIGHIHVNVNMRISDYISISSLDYISIVYIILHLISQHKQHSPTYANVNFLSIQDALGQSQRKVPFTDFFHPTGLQAEARFREEDGHYGAP